MVKLNKEDQKKWRIRNEYVQNQMSNLDLGITFYNIFNKETSSARKEPYRYLWCFADSPEKRDYALNKALELGYIATAAKKYIHNKATDDEYHCWTFKIDLESVNIPT